MIRALESPKTPRLNRARARNPGKLYNWLKVVLVFIVTKTLSPSAERVNFSKSLYRRQKAKIYPQETEKTHISEVVSYVHKHAWANLLLQRCADRGLK